MPTGIHSGPAAGWGPAVRCLALDAVAARTCDLLTMAGIPTMVLKGPATARRLYPAEPSRRSYTDVDLLVPVDRFDAAQDVLRDNGYRWLLAGFRDGEFPWHETAWSAPGSGHLTIDLHRGFAGVPDADAFFSCLWASRDRIDLSGSTVWVPANSATALIVALHAASPGRGRKPLADIHRALEIFAPEVWREAAALARACGAESAFRAGLDLIPDGSRLADDLGVDVPVTVKEWLTARQHAGPSISLAMLMAEPGPGAKLARIVRRVLPSAASVRLRDESARRGPGWLALAYLRRVARLLVAAPRAVSDVIAAQRAVRPRSRSAVHRAQRILAVADLRAVRAAGWAWRAHARSRRQLRRNGLPGVRLSPPRTVRSMDRRAVLAVLRARGASCLERSVVLQRFDAAAGRPRELLIGVTGPGRGFRAHAWLEGDRQRDTALHEITRRAAPQEWVGNPR